MKIEKKIEKPQTFALSYFIGRRCFENDGSQNCFIFQPIYNTFKKPTGDAATTIA